MKKMNLSLSLVAILFGLGLSVSSIRPVKAHNRATAVWFTYNGSGSVTDPANYTEVGLEPSCTGNTSVCGILANPDTNQKPEITPDLSSEITTTLASHSASANVTLLD
jgi:hypothetical protein